MSEYIRVKSEHGGDSVKYSVELQPSVWSITCAFKCEVRKNLCDKSLVSFVQS